MEATVPAVPENTVSNESFLIASSWVEIAFEHIMDLWYDQKEL